jgi:hypothetical protein
MTLFPRSAISPSRGAVGRHVLAVRVDHAQLARNHVADALARLETRLLPEREAVPFPAPLADDRRTERSVRP